MKTDPRWEPLPFFRFPHCSPTYSEQSRLFPFALSLWRARCNVARNGGRDVFPYPLANVRRSFRHALRQWRRIGESTGKGNRAVRRIKAIDRANGPWLNWPEMTVTAS